MLFIYLALIMITLYGVSRVLMPEMAKPKPSGPVIPEPEGIDKKIELMEALLLEKNRNIRQLEAENKVLNVQVSSFSKVKILLDEEIRRLRDQNRIFRSELGLPTVQAKENLTTK